MPGSAGAHANAKGRMEDFMERYAEWREEQGQPIPSSEAVTAEPISAPANEESAAPLERDASLEDRFIPAGPSTFA